MVWQLVLGAFLVLVPFALLLDFHPDRERLDASGRPLRRDWVVPARPAGAAVGPHDANGHADAHH